jgi:hypothetical protein
MQFAVIKVAANVCLAEDFNFGIAKTFIVSELRLFICSLLTKSTGGNIASMEIDTITLL